MQIIYRNRIHIVVFASLLLIAAIAVTMGHHHADHRHHSDCQICVLYFAISTAIVFVLFVLSTLLLNNRRNFEAVRDIQLRRLPSSQESRAPPRL